MKNSRGTPCFFVQAKNRIYGLGSVTFKHIFGNGIGATDFTIEAGADTRNTLLRMLVQLDQPEACAPTFGPFKVIHQRPVQIAAHRNAFLNCAMYHSQMLQDRARAAIIPGIAKAILGNIEWLVATRQPVYRLENAIEALWINLAEGSLRARIVHHSAGPIKTASKQLICFRWIKMHHFARVVVHAMIVARPPGTCKWFHCEIQREGKVAGLSRLEERPVKALLLKRSRYNIGQPEGVGRIEEAIVQTIANARLRL